MKKSFLFFTKSTSPQIEIFLTGNTYGAPIGTLLYNIIIYFKLSIYAKLLVLWSVLQHELYVELKSYGQLYMYGYRSNFLVCPNLVLLWSVST